MMAWPHRGTDWAEQLDTVLPAFEGIAHQILHHQNLIVTSEDIFQVQDLQRHLDAYCRQYQLATRALVIPAPSNDTWARDFGPLTVSDGTECKLLNFQFNGWGGKYDYEKDNFIINHLRKGRAFGALKRQRVEYVLEGGAIDTDGEGTLLITSQCLLDPNRNGPCERGDVEAVLAEHLGIERFLWLDHGHLSGDDTDGHVDTLARFCARDTIAYQGCDNPADSHYPAFSAMAEQLRGFRQANGEPYQLVELPWPDSVHDEAGARLPATYANFLIINGAVLVPQYGVSQDEKALELLGQCFPERTIHGLNCRPLISQGGSLHCLTMQLPPGVWQP